MPPSAGMRFGRYELLSRLGVGGMGEVFRARDHDLHRDVAIKFLPERFAADPARLGRFAQEARAASSLNHPNIVTIHEIGETSGLPYIVMELVEGRTLRELVDGPRPSARRVLAVAAQLADGLAKAHGAGIVHRDLKPENVMVTADGFVKILDFGLAKLRSSRPELPGHPFDSNAPTWPDPPDSPVTSAGTVFGTVGYMSPEQARGREVDFRSDQFAFGAIVYEMASGRRAFHRETPAQTLTDIMEKDPDSLEGLSPAFPPPARWIVERCLEKDPADRYASTVDLARELHTVRERLPEMASSGSAPRVESVSPARLWSRRALGLAGVALVGMVAVLGPGLAERATVALGLRPVPEQKRVAVLPFRALTSSEGDRALASGLADLLTVRLSRLEAFQDMLWVEPSSNVRQSGVESAAGAARALGVTLVIGGSVQRPGGELLLTAVLEDAERSRTLRARTATSADGLVESVVRMLELELGPEAEASLRATGTGVAEAATLSAQAIAYTPFAEGRTALERHEESRSLERAIQLFQQALERDPRYALAHAGLGEAYWRLYRNERRPELVPLAEKHAERALALDDLLAPAWVTLGIIRAGTGRAEEALGAFDEALARDPRNPAAFREKALALERLGRLEEAEATYRRAIELRPGSWAGYDYLGAFLLTHGRPVEGEAALRSALEVAPDSARVWLNLGSALYQQGRSSEAKAAWRQSLDLRPSGRAASNLAAVLFDEGRYAEAARALEKALEGSAGTYEVWHNLAAMQYWAPGMRERAETSYRKAIELAEEERGIDPTDPFIYVTLADSHAILGDGDEARELAARAVSLAPEDPDVCALVAEVYEHLGERARALQLLETALRAGYPVEYVESSPALEALRADPEYRALARGVGREGSQSD